MPQPTTHTLLIAERNPRLAQLLTIFLEAFDYRIIVCDTGAAALELLAAHTCDMVITEAELADMQGVELCQLIRHNRNFRNIPVLFISALSRELELARMMDAGASACLVKPFESSELLNTICRLLDSIP